MTTNIQATVEMDINGRILVPANFRKAFNWSRGSKLTLQSSDKGIILISKKEKIQDTLKKFAKHIPEMQGVQDFLKFRKKDQQ